MRFTDVSKVLLIVLVATVVITNERRLWALLVAIAMSIGFHGLKAGIWFVGSGGSFMVWGPEDSFLEANNSIGLALAMNLPLLWTLAQAETNRWLKRLMLVMALFSVPATVGTYSRGAWIGMATGIVLIVLTSRRKLLLATVLVAAAFVAIPFLPERAENRYRDLVNYQDEGSAQSRFWNWTFAWNVTKAHPLVGAGFDYYSIQAYERYYPEFMERWPGKVWSCHSSWFTILSEHGFIGFAVWIALLLSCLLTLIRAGALRAAGGEPSLPHASKALLLSIVTYFVPATFIDAAYFELLWQLIAGVMIVSALAARASVASVSKPVQRSGEAAVRGRAVSV